MTKVTSIEYDGKFTISYQLSDGRASAFRVDPAMGRLIAAAPGMLNALKLYFNNPTKLNIHKVFSDAIAKAEGEPQ
jgi:hypothetical protein